MTNDQNPCTFQCATHLEHLADIRDFIERSCSQLGGNENCCFQLTLAIDEACTNIIKHGHHEANLAPSYIDLSLQRDADTITVTIVDHGRSFDPDAIPAPDLTGDWRTRRVGGLGWYFIQQISEEVHYHPDEVNGNRLMFRVMTTKEAVTKNTATKNRATPTTD